MSPGPVAFSALWAVRQEAGGLGAEKQPVHSSVAHSCLSTGYQSSGTHPLLLEHGPACGFLSSAHRRIKRGNPKKVTSEVPMSLTVLSTAEVQYPHNEYTERL